MGNTLNTFGKPVFAQTPTQTVADLQAAADFTDTFANVRVGTAAQRGALVAGQIRNGMVFNETDTGKTFRRVSGAWLPAASVATYTYSAGGVPDAALASATIPITAVPAETTDSSFVTSNTGTTLTVKAGTYVVSYTFAIGAAATGRSFAEIAVGSVIHARASAAVGEDTISAAAVIHIPADATAIAFRVFKTSGGLSTVSGRIALQRVV